MNLGGWEGEKWGGGKLQVFAGRRKLLVGLLAAWQNSLLCPCDLGEQRADSCSSQAPLGLGDRHHHLAAPPSLSHPSPPPRPPLPLPGDWGEEDGKVALPPFPPLSPGTPSTGASGLLTLKRNSEQLCPSLLH